MPANWKEISPKDINFYKNIISKKETVDFHFTSDYPVVKTGLAEIKLKYLKIIPIIFNNFLKKSMFKAIIYLPCAKIIGIKITIFRILNHFFQNSRMKFFWKFKIYSPWLATGIFI